MQKEDVYKGRTFTVTSAIGKGAIEFPATVLESYGECCLVCEKKAYVSGKFNQLNIYDVVRDGEGKEHFTLRNIDYSVDAFSEPRYAGSKAEVRERFQKIKEKMQLADSEKEVSESRQRREQKEREATENLKRENFLYISERLTAINDELKLIANGDKVKKLATDKKVIALVNEKIMLEELKTILKLR